MGATTQEADAAFAAGYLAMMNRIGRERGWPSAGRLEYEDLRSARGALAVGNPEQVAEKILFEHELFGHQRYVGQMSVGAVPHGDVLRSMELFAGEVAPRVRAELARREAPPEAPGAHAALEQAPRRPPRVQMGAGPPQCARMGSPARGTPTDCGLAGARQRPSGRAVRARMRAASCRKTQPSPQVARIPATETWASLRLPGRS